MKELAHWRIVRVRDDGKPVAKPFCPRCGEDLNNDEFCTTCGQEFDDDSLRDFFGASRRGRSLALMVAAIENGGALFD